VLPLHRDRLDCARGSASARPGAITLARRHRRGKPQRAAAGTRRGNQGRTGLAGRHVEHPRLAPELWRNDPKEVLSADIAGYLHVQKAEAPERIYELALAEPERTLRAENAARARGQTPGRPPVAPWFDSRRAFSATVVLDEDGPLGFILMPRGNRSAPMTLEEARAVRLLGDRISALLAVSSALARSRERELGAVARADQLDDERQRLEHIILRESGRHEHAAERAARRLRSTTYSPAARLACDHWSGSGV
jgi:hypothetical protein